MIIAIIAWTWFVVRIVLDIVGALALFALGAEITEARRVSRMYDRHLATPPIRHLLILAVLVGSVAGCNEVHTQQAQQQQQQQQWQASRPPAAISMVRPLPATRPCVSSAPTQPAGINVSVGVSHTDVEVEHSDHGHPSHPDPHDDHHPPHKK